MCRILNILLALLSRFLFAAHGMVTVWRVVAVKGEPLYWLLLTGVALLGVEMAVTLKCTRNAEWKWFSPMVFLYLSTVIPSIWFLELSLLQSKLQTGVNNASSSSSSSSSSSGPVVELHLLAHIPIAAGMGELDPENWAAGLEQTMLIVLVLGRWLMPKGDMSRDQLSQLLMVYVGLGADILDIFDTFKEPEVKTNRVVIIVGLALFSWALMQFPLVLTQTRPPKDHQHQQHQQPGTTTTTTTITITTGQEERSLPHVGNESASCCSSEVWSLLLTVGLQDGPFLVYRLYLLVEERVLNQLMIFFTCKNILVVLLELYRIFVVQCEQRWRQSGVAVSPGSADGCACCAPPLAPPSWCRIWEAKKGREEAEEEEEVEEEEEEEEVVADSGQRRATTTVTVDRDRRSRHTSEMEGAEEGERDGERARLEPPLGEERLKTP